MIDFTIPLAPVAWQRVKRGASGIAYVPAKTRRFKIDAATIVKALRLVPSPLTSPLRVTARFVVQKPKRPQFHAPAVRPDLDNYIKAVKDALNGVIWDDDARICELHASKVYDLTGGAPRIEMQVEQLNEKETR